MRNLKAYLFSICSVFFIVFLFLNIFSLVGIGFIVSWSIINTFFGIFGLNFFVFKQRENYLFLDLFN
jgi:hypothetical protein